MAISEYHLPQIAIHRHTNSLFKKQPLIHTYLYIRARVLLAINLLTHVIDHYDINTGWQILPKLRGGSALLTIQLA